jgi:dienelactone hydrolase
MRSSKFFAGLLLVVFFLAQAQEVRPPELVPVYVKIPVRVGGSFNSTVDMTAELFKPDGQGPFPVVVYSHGRSATAQERAEIKEVIPRDYLRFWLAKGFAVVAPMRPGYGTTGGPDREVPGHAWDSAGNCTRPPNYRRVMDVASPTVLATIAWIHKQAWANASSLILTGNSVGGALTVAVGSQNPAGVIGFINFAGGIGGNPSLSPGKSCDPNQLRDMYTAYGKNTKIPSLWMYAENDLLWGADVPKGWHAAFVQGGSASQLVTTAPLTGKDGHDLVFFGKDLWGAPVDVFVKRLGH